ncbi:MAG: glycosyltransferase family 2 protein [Planctomycetia bacterium]|nr:glycosyltransferase family 2 protein [Planctomycetia bacterium]
MLTGFSFGIFCGYVLFTLFSIFLLEIFAGVCKKGRRFSQNNPMPSCPPKVAVLLSLRGADPWLRKSLEGVLQQEYPRFEFFVATDSEEDSAMPILRKVREEHPDFPLHIQTLREYPTGCSLKCACLAQVLESLDDSFEIVAFIDGDVIPHPHWLRELVAPFADERVEFTTGYRWFDPVSLSLGAWVRYVWNLASYVHVYLNGIVWGGSFAVRRSTLKKLDLIGVWKQTVVEDTVTTHLARVHGCKIGFVPSNLMVCQENCTLSLAHRWAARQMLWIRLYSPTIWLRMVAMTLFLVLIHAATFYLLWISWVAENREAFLWILSGLLFFWGATFGMTIRLEQIASKNIQVFQPRLRRKRVRDMLLFLISVPLTVASFSLGMFQTYRTRTIFWRGIEYSIRMAKHVSIKRLNYHPYVSPPAPEKGEQHSQVSSPPDSIW